MDHKAQNEYNYVVALIQEHLNNLPEATRVAVHAYAERCLNAIKEHLVIEPPAKPKTPPEPTAKENVRYDTKASDRLGK